MGTHNKMHPFKGIEIAFSCTVVFAGEDHVPLTFGSFWNSFRSFQPASVEVKFARNDPGARFATFDFSWRLGGWLTLYIDMLTHEAITPLASPRRSALKSRFLSTTSSKTCRSSICGWRGSLQTDSCLSQLGAISSTKNFSTAPLLKQQ